MADDSPFVADPFDLPWDDPRTRYRNPRAVLDSATSNPWAVPQEPQGSPYRGEIKNPPPRTPDPLMPLYEAVGSPIAGGAALGETVSQAGQALYHKDWGHALDLAPLIAAATVPVPGAKGAGGGVKIKGRAEPLPRDLDPMGFYSQALEAAKNLQRQSGPSAGFLNDLVKQGVKKSEIEATGLDKLVAGNPTLTKEQLVQHLTDNRVPVRETKYGPQSEDFTMWLRERGEDLHSMPRPRLEASQREFDNSRAKWSQYSLDPSNPTYRETVLHLPVEATEPRAKEMQVRRDQLQTEMVAIEGRELGKGRSVADFQRTPEYAERVREFNQLGEQLGRAAFKQGHFSDQPNVIAHARTSIQKDAQGKPVFLIDELQSDWGQKLREGGVRDEGKIAELEKRISEERAKLAPLRAFEEKRKAEERGWGGTPEAQAHYQAIRDINIPLGLLEAELNTVRASAPGHPLVNTTDQWTTTALRRLIQQAVDAKAEGIALTPGDIQGDRYGQITRGIKGLLYDPSNGSLYYSQKEGMPNVPGAWMSVKSGVKPVDLPEIVGKEAAQQLLSAPLQPGGYGFKDVHRVEFPNGMEIGGHGMRAAYDKMYPEMLAKQLRRLDPQHPGVGQAMLEPSLDPAMNKAAWLEHESYKAYKMPFHYFPLTPKIREEVAKGLPLFSLGALLAPTVVQHGMRPQQPGNEDSPFAPW